MSAPSDPGSSREPSTVAGTSREFVIESRSPWVGLLLLPIFLAILALVLLVFGVGLIAFLVTAPLLRLFGGRRPETGGRAPKTIDVAAKRVVPRPGSSDDSAD